MAIKVSYNCCMTALQVLDPHLVSFRPMQVKWMGEEMLHAKVDALRAQTQAAMAKTLEGELLLSRTLLEKALDAEGVARAEVHMQPLLLPTNAI